MSWDGAQTSREILLNREWLVTNGLGGYASGTVSGAITRKYHGILVAALPAPLGRVVMWNHVSEFLRFDDGEVVSLGAEERAGGQLDLKGADYLREFRLEDGLPVWIYHVRDLVIEKRVLLPHLQNTVHVSYQIIGRRESAAARAAAGLSFPASRGFGRPAAGASPTNSPPLTTVTKSSRPAGEFRRCGCVCTARASAFTISPAKIPQVIYRTEQARGYAHEGELWSPGFFQVDLADQSTATLIGSTEPWEIVDVLSPADVLRSERERRARLLEEAEPEAREGVAAELVFASDQFVITPAGRAEDAARAHAAGDEVRTVIAGYHWFTDWGRDTMISLEGLTLDHGAMSRGRIHPADLRALRPRRIDPEHVSRRAERRALSHGGRDPLVLPCARPLPRRNPKTASRSRLLLPTLVDIVEHHLRGTKFNIHVDPEDGLLIQGKEGYQLTWMDAKMGDWVVTPRRGKAVEINALWFNALKLLEGWLREMGRRGGGAALRRTGAARSASRSIDAFGSRKADISTMSWMWTAAAATMRRAGRTSSSRSRSTIRCWTRRAGNPWLMSPSANCSRRSAFVRFRRTIRITNRFTAEIFAREMAPIIRARFGPG